MREYNGKQIKYRAKQIVLLAETGEGGVIWIIFCRVINVTKVIIMDIEILSPQMHPILNWRLAFRELRFLNFSIFFLQHSKVARNYIITTVYNKIMTVEYLSIGRTNTKINIQKHWLQIYLLIYDLKRSRTRDKSDTRLDNPLKSYIHQRILKGTPFRRDKNLIYLEKSHKPSFIRTIHSTLDTNLDWSYIRYTETHRFSFKKHVPRSLSTIERFPKMQFLL